MEVFARYSPWEDDQIKYACPKAKPCNDSSSASLVFGGRWCDLRLDIRLVHEMGIQRFGNNRLTVGLVVFLVGTIATAKPMITGLHLMYRWGKGDKPWKLGPED
jgi:hypothetical protein